jgi:L-amino acid N-acyltransferase YncA
MFARLALEIDADAIVELARTNARETRASLPFSETRVRATIERYIKTASPTFFVVEDKREVIAFIQIGIVDYDAFDGLYTTQKVLFVRPDKRGSRASVLLMKELLALSYRLGAIEIHGGNDNQFHSERTAKFLEHFGFERVGIEMRRALV